MVENVFSDQLFNIKDLNSELEIQKQKLLAGNPSIKLVKPCRVDDGVLKIHKHEEADLINRFEKVKDDLHITFFIPASGSGSRMFGKLYDFLNAEGPLKPVVYESIEKLLNKYKDFAFYNKLPRHFKQQLKDGSVNITDLVNYILNEDGLNLGALPKGLIPFHRYSKFIINPFQEHIVQGAKIGGDAASFHFTINKDFEDKINSNFHFLKEMTGIDFDYTFSEQNKETDAYTFNDNNEPVTDENGQFLRRPAGHGALIENLNNLHADLIFIKNIDNVQHYTKAEKSINTKKALGIKLFDFQSTVFKLLNAIDLQSEEVTLLATDINEKYQLKLSLEEISNTQFLFEYFNRPIRLCGMVPNEGQIGGGPFWVETENGKLSRQIIEKSQISAKDTFNSSYLRATHFNPVEIICGVRNYKNEKFDLLQFVNDDHYFLVNKNHKGQQIKYIERPGLWNGAMYNWLTLFYEIDSKCFSPVKNFIDLLNPLHLEKK
ncbi:MAG: DUF4301 family protein [Crocinitomicaceae bacterium]